MPRRNERPLRRHPRHLPTFIGEDQRAMRVKCRCGKVAAKDEKAARRLCEHMQELRGDTPSVRFYQCNPADPHSPWHWTRIV